MIRTALLVGAVCGIATAEEAFVPFVITDGALDPAIAARREAPLTAAGSRIVVKGGHFARDGKRYRAWGVNLCFGACFPTHEDAERVAERLASAGINSVRFHHMDSTAFPRGIWRKRNGTKLSAEALDRLDYFIDRLARRGISSNVNLHVSRSHSRALGLPDAGKLPTYDKMVDLFTPQLIDAQKRYARDLLTHVNRYRKVRHADDPAVAFVEITNEDSLFMWSAARTLPALPPYYARLLDSLFVRHLQKRYGSTAALRRAWSAGASPLGENLLADVEAKTGWRLERHEGCEAEPKPITGTPRSVRVAIRKANATSWHIQFHQAGLSVKGGRYYTIRFRARAAEARKIQVNLSMAHEPWSNLGFSRGVALTTTWQAFRFGLTATKDDENARVSFILGGREVDVDLADVELRPGGRVGLAEAESTEAGNVALFAEAETDARVLDRWRFLAETEKAYFDGMRDFIKKDLGCKALVTGTIVFGPLGLYGQSGMDFIDSHAYWHHPRFPGRPWDPGNWTIAQEAMVDHPEKATLFRLAAERLAGKPFTVSEYNHPAPNDYQAECVPMLATFAAVQDWDGLWLFAYNHRVGEWDRKRFSSFFDICANPAKWGFVRAGAEIFREAGVVPARRVRTIALSAEVDPLPDLCRLHRSYDRDMWRMLRDRAKLDWPDLLKTKVSVRLAGESAKAERKDGGLTEWYTPTWSVQRTADGPKGQFGTLGPRAAVWIGHAGVEDLAANLDVELKAPAFAAVAMVAVDGKPLAETQRFLLAACGRSENTEMRFGPGRRTVGRNWGRAPSRIEAADAAVGHILFANGRFQAQALDSTGKPTGPATMQSWGALSLGIQPYSLLLSPRHRTMWYLITRKAKSGRLGAFRPPASHTTVRTVPYTAVQ